MARSITEEDYKERFEDLTVMGEVLLDIWRNRNSDLAVKLDKSLLYLAVNAAMDDVERYKQYHLEDPATMKSDGVKRAAFMTHWLMRFRPIQINTSDDDFQNHGHSFLLNEEFCITVSVTYLAEDVGKNFVLTPKKTFDVLYELLYRDISPDSLMLFFQTIKDLVKGEKIVQ